MINPSVSSRSRSFRVSESPSEARAIVDDMRVSDSGSPPPGVVTRGHGNGEFSAVALPIATAVNANFTVKPDGAGGSIVTEHHTAGSFIPGMAHMANTVHGAVISPQEAYFAARARRR